MFEFIGAAYLGCSMFIAPCTYVMYRARISHIKFYIIEFNLLLASVPKYRKGFVVRRTSPRMMWYLCFVSVLHLTFTVNFHILSLFVVIFSKWKSLLFLCCYRLSFSSDINWVSCTHIDDRRKGDETKWMYQFACVRKTASAITLNATNHFDLSVVLGRGWHHPKLNTHSVNQRKDRLGNGWRKKCGRNFQSICK